MLALEETNKQTMTVSKLLTEQIIEEIFIKVYNYGSS